MSIGSHNRIYSVHNVIKHELFDRELRKQHGQRSKLHWQREHHCAPNMETVDCTQCHRKMKKSFADLQLHYGKKNAPICIPCIEGKPRKPLNIKK